MQFRKWRLNCRVEPIALQVSLISEKHQYGGTPDCIAMIEGRVALVEFKTSLKPYADHLVAMSAHAHLVGREQSASADREIRVARAAEGRQRVRAPLLRGPEPAMGNILVLPRMLAPGEGADSQADQEARACAGKCTSGHGSGSHGVCKATAGPQADRRACQGHPASTADDGRGLEILWSP